MTAATKKTLQDVAQMLERAGWDDHSIHIGGNVTNSQVGQTLINCTNMANQQPAGPRQELVETLNRDAQKLIETLPEDKKDEAAENLEMLLKQATGKKPNRDWYSLSAKGLLEAATWVKDFSGNIGASVLDLGKLIWPDFKLPGA